MLRPWWVVLLVAPYVGEGLSGSSPPSTLLQPAHLAFMIALYGGGALICREVARRGGLGLGGLVLLGAAYGVYEEGLVDRYWYLPSYWADSGVGDYSVVGHTNVVLATHLTVFHAVVSICLSVLVVEWCFPGDRDRPWVRTRGLVLAALGLAAAPVVYGEFDQRPPIGVLLIAALVMVLLVVAAFVLGRRAPALAGGRAPDEGGRPRRWLGTIAFATTLAFWIATYSVPETDLPWPLGVGVMLVPLVLGALLLRARATGGPYGPDAVRIGAGVAWFFVLLDVVVGINGQYDMLLTALVTAVAIVLLRRRLSP